MNVFIRVDASDIIGSGHVMRCLTIAEHLKKNKIKVIFLSRELKGNLCRYIKDKGYEVHCLSLIGNEKFNWEEDSNLLIDIIKGYKGPKSIIVDHYLIDSKWESKIRPYVSRVMVIDDLANRKHDTDILLDQNLNDDIQLRYNGLVPQNCKLFLGPNYVLLREEFITARENLQERSGQINRIFIFFGGSDPTNETFRILQSLKKINLQNIVIDVVVGKSNIRKETIENICNQYENISYYCQIENMAELMAKADLAIGAGGSTTWERCYLGLPTITIIVAENQAQTTKAVEKTGAILNLGYSEEISEEEIINAIKRLLTQPSLLKEMSRKSLSIIEISGSINNILNHFIEG